MMKRFILTVLTLLMASAAFADSYLYVDNFTVGRSMMDNGEKIVVPVHAHFDARVQSWEMTLSLPYGLSLESIVMGQDMGPIPYVSADGTTAYSSSTLQIFGDRYVGTASWYEEGYWSPGGSGALESYGLVKWEAGEYEEMLRLIFYAYSDFQGGDLTISTTVYSTEDARGGTVNENGDAGCGYTLCVSWEAEEAETTPEPVITFVRDEFDMGVNVSVDGEGLKYAEITINGESYDVYDVSSECPGVPNWYIEREYFHPKYIQVTAIAQLPGQYASTAYGEYFLDEIPPIESPVPVISYEVYENHAIVWANFDESLPYNPYNPEGESGDPEWSNEYVLLLDGEYVNNPYWVDRPEPGEGDLILNFSAYSWVLDGTPSEYAYLTVVIPEKTCNFFVDDICYSATGYDEASVTDGEWYGYYYYGEVVIPENVTWEDMTYTVTGIKDQAFCYNNEVTAVTLPATIASIGEQAFYDCTGLATIICYAAVPPSLGPDCFKCCDDENAIYDRATLFVPNESVEAYRNQEGWDLFVNIVPFLGAGPGDMNGDGSINISDVINIINLISNAAADDLPAYCDLNGDGSVNITDVTTLINMIVNSK